MLRVWPLVAGSTILLASLFGCSEETPLRAPSGESNAQITDRDELSGENGAVVPGEFIVVLKSREAVALGKVSKADALQVAQSASVKPRNVYGSVLSGFSASLSEHQYQALASNPAVAYIEPNRIIKVASQAVPWGVTKVAAPLAHSNSISGSGVKVAILDTGIKYDHADLADNYVSGYDFISDDSDPMDDNGHGTHVAGTVAAVDNSVGVLGAAPEASLYAVKVLNSEGEGTDAELIAGLDWAVANSMDVVNMSLGSTETSQSKEDACDSAYAAGIVLCAAAGNGGGVMYPAAYESCIAVSATNYYNNFAWFSSYGSDVEVCAPGVDIYSTYGSSYETLDGTSMATPHVSGVCALILAAGQYQTPPDVREQLTSTCIDLGESGRDDYYGYGLVSAAAATGSTTGNQNPVADAGGPYNSLLGSPITFAPWASNDVDGGILDYLWRFGDGDSSVLANPQHTYSSIDDYIVTLTVTDNLGATDTDTTEAVVVGDVVTITLAQCGIPHQPFLLRVRATSSQQPTPTLTLAGIGTMTWNSGGGYYEYSQNYPCPIDVTVTSSLGGTDTEATQ